MAFCKQCGAELMEGGRFCTTCGAEATAAAEPVISSEQAPRIETPSYQPPAYAQPSYVSSGSERREPAAPAQTASNGGGYQSAYQQSPNGQSTYSQQGNRPPYTPPAAQQSAPMSTGQFLGTLLLMMIPIAGFILMLVWAFGGTDNLNRRNLARAKLILVAIGLVLCILFTILFSALAFTLVDELDGMQWEFGDRFDGFSDDFHNDFSDEFSEDFFNQSFRTGNGAFVLR